MERGVPLHICTDEVKIPTYMAQTLVFVLSLQHTMCPAGLGLFIYCSSTCHALPHLATRFTPATTLRFAQMSLSLWGVPRLPSLKSQLLHPSNSEHFFRVLFSSKTLNTFYCIYNILLLFSNINQYALHTETLKKHFLNAWMNLKTMQMMSA